MNKDPSKERGCAGKTNLGRGYDKQARRLANKHKRTFGVYRCPHCGGTHLTTKLHKSRDYKKEILMVAKPSSEEART